METESREWSEIACCSGGQGKPKAHSIADDDVVLLYCCSVLPNTSHIILTGLTFTSLDYHTKKLLNWE